jgi:hypothetical protein
MRYALSIISLVAAAALFVAYGAGPYAPECIASTLFNVGEKASGTGA